MIRLSQSPPSHILGVQVVWNGRTEDCGALEDCPYSRQQDFVAGEMVAACPHHMCSFVASWKHE